MAKQEEKNWLKNCFISFMLCRELSRKDYYRCTKVVKNKIVYVSTLDKYACLSVCNHPGDATRCTSLGKVYLYALLESN